jgi:hypothetical protein
MDFDITFSKGWLEDQINLIKTKKNILISFGTLSCTQKTILINWLYLKLMV